MRNFIFTLLLSLPLFNITLGQTIEQAITYNDAIIDKNDEIITQIELLMDVYDKYIPEEMDKAYNSALSKTQESIEFVNTLRAFKREASFKEGALKMFNTYKSILKVEHKRIIELLKLPDAHFGEKEVAEFNQLTELANKKVEEELNKLILIQEKFAKTHQFEISK